VTEARINAGQRTLADFGNTSCDARLLVGGVLVTGSCGLLVNRFTGLSTEFIGMYSSCP